VQTSQTGSAWGSSHPESEDEPAYIRVGFIAVDWKTINPPGDVFDFSSIESELNKQKRPVVIRINWYGACAAPSWVLSDANSLQSKTLVFWDQAYRDALTPLVNAFASSYANDSRIEGVYMGIADGHRSTEGDCDSDENGWGEFWMTSEEITEAETDFGFSPSVFESETKKLIDIFANAFGENSKKLAITNIYQFVTEEISPYNDAIHNLADYALNAGLGMRDGAIENWARYIDPSYHVKLALAEDNTSRLITDEAFGQALGDRYWGGENEFYGGDDYIIDSTGPYSNQPYRFYVSSMRSLQQRNNYVAISYSSIADLPASEYEPQDLLLYLSKVYGRNINDTPDAFTMLGERYVDAETLIGDFQNNPAVFDGMLKIRGIERWLSEIGSSEPARRIEMPESEQFWAQDYMPEGIDYEYSARKSNTFHFDMSDELVSQRCANGCDLEIKVSYQGGTGSSSVRASFASIWIESQDMNSPTISASSEEKLYTATFPLHTTFNNGLDRNADFMIHVEGDELSILLVRVVFLQK
jgi:hypothetical protein